MEKQAINVQQLPDLHYHDIYNYLVKTSSDYTKEAVKAYKSLDVAGWVNGIQTWNVPQKQRVLVMSQGSTKQY